MSWPEKASKLLAIFLGESTSNQWNPQTKGQ